MVIGIFLKNGEAFPELTFDEYGAGDSMPFTNNLFSRYWGTGVFSSALAEENF
ncbi:MAG: hypothetical protein ACXVDC_16990 [Bacteroidia bacterium]